MFENFCMRSSVRAETSRRRRGVKAVALVGGSA
jgi:hypothetical protein